MRTVRINVGMNQLDAILVPGTGENGHRGLWFYDPTSVDPAGEIRAGDTVYFTKFFSEVVALGTVTEVVDPEAFPKLCSRINSRGFRWTPDDRAREELISWTARTVGETAAP
jgi:hypothetical protein